MTGLDQQHSNVNVFPLSMSQLCTFLSFPLFSSPPIAHWLWLRHLFTGLLGNEQTALFLGPAAKPRVPEADSTNRASLRSVKSKNSPLTHSLTHIHTCMHTHQPALSHIPTLSYTQTHPSVHSYSQTLHADQFKKISAETALVVKPFPVYYSPHISRFLQTGTEACLCAADCYFYPLCQGHKQAEWRLFHWHTHTHTQCSQH